MLDQIGFYTLSDERARTATINTPITRAEVIVTGACQFKCPYCRGLQDDINGTMELGLLKDNLNVLFDNHTKNIRFSGGEPTLYKHLNYAVCLSRDNGCERIAVSSNGYNDIEVYHKLIQNGVNDFSISLDACCSSIGDMMSGVKNSFSRVVDNIAEISKLVYTTVGAVLNEDNFNTVVDVIEYADSLGVSDIRIIPSAQYNKRFVFPRAISKEILNKYPILNYRVNNFNNGIRVRGITKTDCRYCPLVLDDVAIAGMYHFPCIIYMRERGDPIGIVDNDMRSKRGEWYIKHDTHLDPICYANCLDVCIDYNNEWEKQHQW
jgi:MoaA/NifB/PqqE/SkfB family radical SAM enzyme